MTCPGEFNRLAALILAVWLSFAFQGFQCDLLVSPVGPSLVNAIAGRNVTLPVSFSGAPDPVVTWFMGNLPVATWTVNSSLPPDIDNNRQDVLRIEKDGSLSFQNVPLSYDSTYKVELTKSGLDKALTTFTLRLFEIFQDLTLTTEPDLAIEGTDEFKLRYNLLTGVVDHQTWFLNGQEIQNSQHYSMEQQNLTIFNLNRGDTGEYEVSLTNPFSRVTARKNITVRYGPDEPVLETHPTHSFFISGVSLNLSCQAEGFPPPRVVWTFNDQILRNSPGGVLELISVSTSQGGVYTCTLVNDETGQQRQKSLDLKIYERPLGDPVCSVQALNDDHLLYRCGWTGGTPQAHLSFPALNTNSSEEGILSLTMEASDSLNGQTIHCVAKHILGDTGCNITAISPGKFVPSVRTSVDDEGKIVVGIHCLSHALPEAVVSWSRGGEGVTSGSTHQISINTTLLRIRHLNVSNFLLQNYSCTCRNPLGSQRREIQLHGPLITDSSLFPNQDGTIITLTWEVPPTSVVTGFDIQMKGPDLLNPKVNTTGPKSSSKGFRTIQQKPGSSRSADVYILNPKSTYRFRIVPKARLTAGEPSQVHRIGPGEGLSGPAVAGIAAGIPCSLLFLLLLCVLIYLCFLCYKKRDRQTSYPITRGVEKKNQPKKPTLPEKHPHNLLAGGLRSPPDYNRLHQTPSERSVTLPTFVPPPPVRVATTV